MVVIFAPETVRWRDLIFAGIALGLLFLPFFLWELSIKFADIHVLSHLSRQPSRIDNQAINYYQLFLQLYGQQPISADALTRRFIPLLFWVGGIVMLLLVGGYILTVVDVLKLRFTSMSLPWSKKASPTNDVQERGQRKWWTGLWNWWLELRASPERCGLCLLLAWQIVPLAALSRHNISLHPQYLLVVMPGPFVLIGLFVARLAKRWQMPGQLARVLRSSIYALIALVFVAQLLGSTVAVIDISGGKYNDRDFYFDYYNDLASLQHALSEADQLAQQQHLSRVYITTDSATQAALRYLSEQMHTPTTLFDTRYCLVLPNPADGPAVFLVGPYDTLSNALLSQFATAKLVDQPGRLGGPPFRLYIVTTPMTSTASQTVLGHDVALVDAQAQHLYTDTPLQVTHWRFLRSAQPALNTTYNYIVTASSHTNGETARKEVTCTFTAIRAGDQLLVATGAIGRTLTLGVHFYATTSYNPSFGPLHLETDVGKNTPITTLRTPAGTATVTVSG